MPPRGAAGAGEQDQPRRPEVHRRQFLSVHGDPYMRDAGTGSAGRLDGVLEGGLPGGLRCFGEDCRGLVAVSEHQGQVVDQFGCRGVVSVVGVEPFPAAGQCLGDAKFGDRAAFGLVGVQER